MDENNTLPNEIEAGLKCIPLSAIQSITILMVVDSILLNSFMLCCCRKAFRHSTYAVCLMTMSTNNLVASCISLPLYYMEVYSNDVVKYIPLQLANALCVTRYVSIITCLAVGLCTLNIICWDRYEALTRLGKARRITPIIAGRIILAVIVIVVSFLLITNFSVLKYMADGNLTCKSKEIDKYARMSTIAVMVLVSVIIIISKAIAIFTFSSIAKQIRRHIAEVRQTLGNQNAVKELNLVKVSVVIFVAYTVSWLPFGVSRGLMNAIPNRAISCFYSISSLWAYSLFSFLPLLCICTDKKMKSSLRKMFLCNRVAPAAPQVPNNVSTRITSN